MTTAKPYTPQWYADLMDRTQSRYCEADMDQLRAENLRLNELCIDVRAQVERLKGDMAGDQQRLFHYEGEIERQAQRMKTLDEEIERLRLDARAYADVMLSEENDALIEDNKRLRAALKAICDTTPFYDPVVDIARQALGEQGKGWASHG